MEYIPNGTFHDITSVAVLILENNHFQVMPINNICLLKRLKKLNMASNKLTTVKFNQCFAKMEVLHYVNLSDNPIVELNSDDFYGLRKSPIAELYLNRIGIKHITKGTFEYLTHVKLLSLKGNKIGSLPSDVFKNILDIKLLDLSGNKFSRIPTAAIARLSRLSTIDLTHNRIQNNTLGSEFQNMTNLHSIVLSENPLHGLSNSSFLSLASSKKFNILVLKSVSLKIVEADAFSPLKFLTTLTLNDNQLMNVSLLERAFYGLRFCFNLTELGLDNTNLTGIGPYIFQYMANTSLVKLYAQGCLITMLPSGTFKYLPNYRSLGYLAIIYIPLRKTHSKT